MSDQPATQLLTVQQVAELSGWSEGTIRAHLAPSGSLPCIRLTPGPSAKRRTRGGIRIKRSDYEAWIERHRQAPAGEAPARAARSLSIRDLPGADRYLS